VFEPLTVSNKIGIRKVAEGTGIDEIHTVDTCNYKKTYEVLKKTSDSEKLDMRKEI